MKSFLNTKERISEELDYNSFMEQKASYFFEIQKIKESSSDLDDKIVIDCACGSGYGTNVVYENLKNKVFGIDIDEDAVAYCKNRYAGPSFASANLLDIDHIVDGLADIFISNQTLEHFKETDQFLVIDAIYNKIRKDGLCFVAVPNKPVYQGFFEHDNPYHLNELDFVNFERIIKSKGWNNFIIYGQFMPSYQINSNIRRNKNAYFILSFMPKFIVKILKKIVKTPQIRYQ